MVLHPVSSLGETAFCVLTDHTLPSNYYSKGLGEHKTGQTPGSVHRTQVEVSHSHEQQSPRIPQPQA